MKLPAILLFTLCFCLQYGVVFADLGIAGKAEKIAVFTDYEADDSVAIGLLLTYLKEQGVQTSQDFMFDALFSNQYRKKALVQKLVGLFGYADDTVYAGTGGIKDPFEEEGQNILDEESLTNFLTLNHQDDEANHEAITQFASMLNNAQPNSIDVLMLTNPIDFVKALDNDADNLKKIRTIYMMGGWFGNRPSFNWSMCLDSITLLLQLMDAVKGDVHSPALVLFSSHFFAREFNGYINHTKFPNVIEAFDNNPSPIVEHFRHMVKNWDASMTVIKDHHSESEKQWRLEMVDRIGKENIGRQFAPADPATVFGYLYPESILELTPTSIKLTNAVVECQVDPSSNIFVVEKLDIAFFDKKLVHLMQASHKK